MGNEDRVLDWVPRFDEKSRLYPIRTAVPTTLKFGSRRWRSGPILDQGYEGACVGFGWSADAFATPIAVDLNRVKADVPRDHEAFARFVYRNAQKIDEWEGESYEGTSVLAGAKAMSALGLIKEYRWAFSVDDVILALLRTGPVVLGTEWRDGMYEAPGGVLTPSGRVVGGHCYTAVGYHSRAKELDGQPGVYVQNSWGTSWGNGGTAVISVDNLADLLANNGEACVPFRRSYGRS